MYYVTNKQRQEVRQRSQLKGDVSKIEVDFSSWAEDHSDATSVTWTVESGNASISSESLSSNVASALLTTSESGMSMVKLVATDGTHSEAVYIRVRCRDPQVLTDIPDYGMVL